MNIESVAIRYFREVYRLRSIRQASSLLNVAPSAISRQILRLEQMVGMPLFERLPRGVAPTEAAEVLARFSRNFLLDVERVRGEIDSLRGLNRGHVRIMSNEGLIAYLLNRTIAAFRRKFPGISYELTVASTGDIARYLGEGAADVGFVFNAEPDRQLSLAARIRDPLCAVLAPGHPLAGTSRLSMKEILEHPIGIPERNFGIRRLIDAAVSAEKLQMSPVLVSNSMEALKGFARYSGGITFMPTLPIRRELDRQVLVSVPVTEETFQRTSHDVYVLAERRLPLAVEKFLEQVKIEADHPPED